MRIRNVPHLKNKFESEQDHVPLDPLGGLGIWAGPGWGPGRVGAQSGLGPGPGWGPYGPIWALMFFVKNVTFRVQTAPFDKITIDFWRSRRRLYIPDLLKAKNSNVRLSFFKGSVFIKSVMFRVQTAPFDKITIDFCRSRRCLHDSDLPGAQNPNIFSKNPENNPKIQKNTKKSMDS